MSTRRCPRSSPVLPVLLAHPASRGRPWSGNDEHSYGARFVAAQLAAGKLRSVTFASRLLPLAGDGGRRVRAVRVAAELSGPLAGALAGVLRLASPLRPRHRPPRRRRHSLHPGHYAKLPGRWSGGCDCAAPGGWLWLGLALAAVAEPQSWPADRGGSLAVIAASQWRVRRSARAPARAPGWPGWSPGCACLGQLRGPRPLRAVAGPDAAATALSRRRPLSHRPGHGGGRGLRRGYRVHRRPLVVLAGEPGNQVAAVGPAAAAGRRRRMPRLPPGPRRRAGPRSACPRSCSLPSR